MLTILLALLFSASTYTRTDYVTESSWAKARKTVLAAHKRANNTWLCQYSGKSYRVDDSLDIDHIVPLKYAHQHGMDSALPARKKAFGKDTLNLVQVSAHINRSKGDKGPVDFFPVKNRCFYASRWDSVTKLYGIYVEPADSVVLANVRRHCR